VILPKLILNQVIKLLIENFKLDKIRDYVFEDNELDEKVKNLENRLNLLESMAHPPKNFECNYKIEEENKNG
jgi:hypothetical protein